MSAALVLGCTGCGSNSAPAGNGNEAPSAEAPAAGIDEALLANAVARGVAMAMMNNPQAQTSPEYIQNSIYLDGSVLARVLSKAQREIDYRMNPTPQFG